MMISLYANYVESSLCALVTAAEICINRVTKRLLSLPENKWIGKVKREHSTLSGMMNLSGSTCVLHESEYFVLIAYNAIREGF